MDRDTIIVTDKTFLVYLTSKGIAPVNAVRKENRVEVEYANNQEFKDAKLKFLGDNHFSSVLSGMDKVETLFRTTP